MKNAVFNPDTWGHDYDDTCYACGTPVHITSDEDGTPIKTVARMTDEMIERACVVLEDAGYEDTGAMDRPTVREALLAALNEPSAHAPDIPWNAPCAGCSAGEDQPTPDPPSTARTKR